MARRRYLVFVLAGVLPSLGASFRTTNFVVEAPTPQLAQQFGQTAEYWRRQKAMDWLGQEMPAWPEPCPLTVHVTMGGAGGATQFSFDRGQVLGQNMNIEGSLDRLLVSVLPHEVTHTVFAYYFRTPVPRWADEGGAVLSEDDLERNRHDRLCRDILNSGHAIPLRRLFALRDYPHDVMALYAEGFSVVQFLVNQSNRQVFLGFIHDGMTRGWDTAAQAYYHYANVDDLEKAWLDQLRRTRRQPVQLAQNNPAPVPTASPAVVLRQTVPPAQPDLGPPTAVVRGQAPTYDQEGDRAETPSRLTAGGRPGYLPDNDPRGVPASYPASGQWQPAGTYRPPIVTLGSPQTLPPPPPMAAPALQVSPVGYPE